MLWLAYRDARREYRITLCLVLALLAVLAPLLVLFGLKFGLVDTLASRLIEMPQNREIVGVGSGNYDAAWFQGMAKRPDVAFVVPSTRRIAASLSSLRNPRSGEELKYVQMLPTGPGDPLLGGVAIPDDINEVVVAALTARKLGVSPGDRVEARIERRTSDYVESVCLELEVVAVAPEAALARDGVFLRLELLVATEDYRDGLAVPQLRWPGNPPIGNDRRFARFRLYASSIYEVSSLQASLIAAGIDVRTQAAEIEAMQLLDLNLSRVFWLLATLGSAGLLASLAAILLANVDRKRRELGMLRLLGVPTRSLIFFPVTQGLLVGAVGASAAFFVYRIIEGMLNAWFASSLQPGERICQLDARHMVLTVLATCLCTAVASAWAGYRVASIAPAEGQRDL